MIFHARRYLPETERNAVNDAALNVCGRIVLAALEAKHPGTKAIYDAMYPVIEAA